MKLVKKTGSTGTNTEDMKGKGKHSLSLYLLSVLHIEPVISTFHSKCLFLCLPHKAKKFPADLTQAAFRRVLHHVKHANGANGEHNSSQGETERRTVYACLQDIMQKMF